MTVLNSEAKHSNSKLRWAPKLILHFCLSYLMGFFASNHLPSPSKMYARPRLSPLIGFSLAPPYPAISVFPWASTYQLALAYLLTLAYLASVFVYLLLMNTTKRQSNGHHQAPIKWTPPSTNQMDTTKHQSNGHHQAPINQKIAYRAARIFRLIQEATASQVIFLINQGLRCLIGNYASL